MSATLCAAVLLGSATASLIEPTSLRHRLVEPAILRPCASRRAPAVRAQSVEAETETALLRLCAASDRGQRASPSQRQQLRFFVESLEASAPPFDARDLNGEWRLLLALDDAPYRSSPFFWAFRQATSKFSIPSSVASGGALSSAVYAITDAIPLYDIGSVVQRISNVCSDTFGCRVDEPDGVSTDADTRDDASADGATNDATPSEGTETRRTPTDGVLESQVELILGRNFGLPRASSLMTTRCAVSELPAPPTAASVGAPPLDLELRVQTTAARQSSLAAALPALFAPLDSFAFPSGDSLDALRPRSSCVTMRTTYLSQTLRVSRPVLDLQDAPLGSTDDGARAIFVYARE